MTARPLRNLQSLLCCVTLALSATESSASERLRVVPDIEFAQVGNARLCLDLYLPKQVGRPKLVLWVHGGAWRSGTRSDMPMISLVDAGYAVASVDYRLSHVALFPAQVHDVKAAIRYLRRHQERLGIDARRVAVAGASAGGHLAALVGLANDRVALDGDVGTALDQSSDVQAVVDMFGPTNLTTILDQSTPSGLDILNPAVRQLLGGTPEDKPDLARLASPALQVDSGDPPLLVIHGDQDPQVPISQSHELVGQYRAAKLPVQLEVISGGGHGGKAFLDEERRAIVKAFLDEHL